jgi:hypothetical protein
MGCQRSGVWGAFFVNLCYQHPSGHYPLLDVGLVDGGEGRIGALRCRDVVEADNGNVLGHGDTPLGHPFDGAKRELIARGEDGRRSCCEQNNASTARYPSSLALPWHS